MANVKITQLPSATTPLTGTEVFPLVQGTTTKQVAITGLFTSPVMTNPTLGTVGQADLINATGLPISTGVAGLGTGIATFLGTPSSANLRAAVTDETGTGSLVFATSPTLVTPNLGTPSVLVATNATGTALGLIAGSAVTNANLTGAVTSVGNATSLGSFTSAQLATALTDETGSGANVFATSPVLVTPNLGTPSAAVLTNATGLPISTGVSGLGTGVATFLATPSSANLAAAVSDETGSGALVFATSPTLVTPALGTPTSGNFSTGTFTWPTFNQNTTGTAAGLSATLAIASGGTGQTTANAAFNALAPSQTGNSGKYLTTDGTNSSWATNPLGTVTSVAASVPSFLSIAGSPITTSGTLAISLSGTALPTTSGGTGLTSFTSGGVVYASSSSALATGSGFTFDGTKVEVNSAYVNANSGLNVTGSGSSATGTSLEISYGAVANTARLFAYDRTGAARKDILLDGLNLLFNASGSEGMRLTSTGLGIGTSTVLGKLTVQTQSTARLSFRTTDAVFGTVTGGTALDSLNGSDSAVVPFGVRGSTLTFGISSGIAATIDASGNLGLGVTPSAWGSTYRAMQIGLSSSLVGISNDTQTHLTTNARFDGTNWIYIGTSPASRYMQDNNVHKWFNAASGSGGTNLPGGTGTQAMTLDASGNLGIGSTSPGGNSTNRVVLAYGSTSAAVKSQSSATTIALGAGGGEGYVEVTGAYPLEFIVNGSERARITSGGYFKASNAGTYQVSTGSYHELRQTTDETIAIFTNTSASLTGTARGIKVSYTAASPNDTGNYLLYCDDSTTLRAGFRSNGGLANYAANNAVLSDRREKTNFAPATSYLDKICAIPVQTFNFIDQNLETDAGLTLGVVAQDVQAVAPELVTEGNWGTKDNPKMRLEIYQTDLQYALMKCIQEQQAIIESLKARLDAANL